MAVAIVFPGQGAEEPGMGLELAARDARAKRLLAIASEATGVDLVRALERGGRALSRTEVLQPALMAVSLGAAYAREAQIGPAAIALGHSLGELTAACFALGLDDETAISLAAMRGRLMAQASEQRRGGMIAVDALPSSGSELHLAAHNADDEHVLTGDEEAITRFARTHGGTRLRVGGAWHSPAMEPVIAPLRTQLDRAMTGRPMRMQLHAGVLTRTGVAVEATDGSVSRSMRLLSAVSAEVVSADAIGDVLSRGVVAPVRWVETLRALSSLGIDRIEIATPGRLSRSLVRRTLGTTIDLAILDASP